MYPILFQFGPITLYTYGAAMALAFLTTVGLAAHATRHQLKAAVPIAPSLVVDWGCWTMVGGVLGGRLLYVLLNWQLYAVRPVELLALWHGGLVWYGGFLGGLLAQTLFFARRRIPLLAGTDQIIPFVALGHAIGRLGCFANGCCYGKPTEAWYGVWDAARRQMVAPTQLLEAAGLVALYVFLRSRQRPAVLRQPGALFGRYLIGYGALRWLLEWWRADQPLVWGGWTVFQLLSVAAMTAGAALIFRTKLVSNTTDISRSARQ